MDQENATTDSDRLFPLQGYGEDFETGRCTDGRQAVMGLLCPNLVTFFFDAQGNLNGKESRLWKHPAPQKDGIYDIYDTAFQAALAQQKSHWKMEVGFQPGVIHIKQFLDETHPVGIEILPEHYQDLETSDDFEDDEERQGWIQDRDEWLKRGDFVWWWAKDYYRNAAGEVDST